MDPEALLESSILRRQLCREENASILERVGQLAMLPNTDYATGPQMAEFYQVAEETIRTMTARNKKEFIEYGYKILTKKEITEFHNETLLSLFKSRSKNIALFPRPAILLAGCLLRDSDVARDIRRYLIGVEALSPLVLQEISQLKTQMESWVCEIREILQKHEDRVSRCEEDIDYLKKWLLSMETQVYEWDNFFHEQKVLRRSEHTNTISPKQARILKQKITDYGADLREFKKYFEIRKYSSLPSGQWQTALEWLDKYAEQASENHDCNLSKW